MLAELDEVLAQVEPYDVADAGEGRPRLRRADRPQDGRRGQPAARGRHRAGRRAGPLRLPGHPRPRDAAGPGSRRRWRCSQQPSSFLIDMPGSWRPSLDRALEDDPMRIFVTGSIAFDYIMVFPGRFRDHILPDKMHVLSVSFLVDSLTRLRGGTGANIAYNLGLLGEQPVLVGTVGRGLRRVSRLARGPRRRLPGRPGHRRRAHGLVLHQHRPAGQPDHGVLSRRDGAGGVDLDPRDRGHAATTWS